MDRDTTAELSDDLFDYSINVLMLDPKRVVMEASQKTLIAALRNWGVEPIPCPFLNYAPFGGSFHCATLDIRRRGELESVLLV